MGRKSFIVFCDRLNELELLTDEQAGKLIKDLLAYHNRGVRRKYKVSNKIGVYFTQILWDIEEMKHYYAEKGSSGV